MGNLSRSGMVSPVLDGVFPDGHDTVLLHPAVTARHRRRRQILAAVGTETVLKGLAGTIAVGFALVAGNGFAGKFIFAAVVLIVVLAGWRAVCAAREYRGSRDDAPRTRLRRGEGWRSRDFTDLGPDTARLVRELLAGVDELHRTPARAWIDPALPGEAHRVVWEAVCCLDRSRDVRVLAEELATDPDAGEDLVTAARQAITTIDQGLAEVARHLHGCLLLTRAWEAKLRHTDLTRRTGHVLVALPGHDHLRRLTHAAEVLPQNVFAHVTAARDLTHAGEFPWERPSTEWPRLTLVPPHRATTTPTRADDQAGERQP
ncbi:hypothetical protein SD37_39835 [Amycolatopsis orientalis]|uniref:Uncharacterized protein n=1 Tax=Amycolatopsis orientalis TaxID=31958 RepID=A0A193C9L5_AMYOR|nr:hypothetical protein [Amycolatopsis orientalis]ANN21139.1 hypothetical protein SD37_39835 [Amycolatopsis orientalis]